MIIDTKYKSCYAENKYNIDDIRQLSGYARDKGVLKIMEIDNDNEVVDCVVIYPTDNKNKKNMKMESNVELVND